MKTFAQLDSDAHRASIFQAAKGWNDTTTTQQALVAAYNALEARGAAPGILLVITDLLQQRGCDELGVGGRDDRLTTLCDVVMRG